MQLCICGKNDEKMQLDHPGGWLANFVLPIVRPRLSFLSVCTKSALSVRTQRLNTNWQLKLFGAPSTSAFKVFGLSELSSSCLNLVSYFPG